MMKFQTYLVEVKNKTFDEEIHYVWMKPGSKITEMTCGVDDP